MSKKETYTLDFVANTTNAKAQLASLKASLKDIADLPIKGSMSQDLQDASKAAVELQGHLKTALNPNTGKMDLTRLSVSLKNSGKDANYFAKELLKAGSSGKKAFLETSNAIMNSQKSIIQTNEWAKRLGNTFKNNIRWQVSGYVIDKFTGALSSAVQYAKDLDKSLNDIRIVTGDSKKEMEAFATAANRTAKAVGATTLDVVKATLIYRQQGDTAELAAKKAEITTKAANVAFTASAQEMSEYLTAVWNSYQVGGDQLELYVDKMAKIGAISATSSEELATGMTKVAATAKAVGVTYDQLLATIGTVSSATRLSAESVGTGFKTIYANINDLKLKGSFLDEDGVVVSLGKVSGMLKNIGMDIVNADDTMVDSGKIVEELGDKWNTLNESTKTAIASTLGGKRQITLLNALFGNWDEYKRLLSGAEGAMGTLNEQNEIYKESWEAASKAVQTSIENISDSFFDTDAIIDMTYGVSHLVDLFEKLTKAGGGFGSILTTLASIGLNKFIGPLSDGLAGMTSNLLIFTGLSNKINFNTRNKFANLMGETADNSPVEQAQIEFLEQYNATLNERDKVYGRLNKHEREYLDGLIESVFNAKELQEILNNVTEIMNKAKRAPGDLAGLIDATKGKVRNMGTGMELVTGNSLDLNVGIRQNVTNKAGTVRTKTSQIVENAYKKMGKDMTSTNYLELVDVMKQSKTDVVDVEKVFKALGTTLSGNSAIATKFAQVLMDLYNSEGKVAEGSQAAAEGFKEKGEEIKRVREFMQGIEKSPLTITEGIVSLTSALSSVMSTIYGISNAINTLTNEEASSMDKFSSIIGIVVPALFMINTLRTNAITLSIKEWAMEQMNHIGKIKFVTLEEKAKLKEMITEKIRHKVEMGDIAEENSGKAVQIALNKEIIATNIAAALGNPYTYIAAGIAAVVAALIIFTKTSAKAEKAYKNMKKASEDYNKTQEELQNNVKELEDKEKQLKEINDLQSKEDDLMENRKNKLKSEIQLLKTKQDVLNTELQMQENILKHQAKTAVTETNFSWKYLETMTFGEYIKKEQSEAEKKPTEALGFTVSNTMSEKINQTQEVYDNRLNKYQDIVNGDTYKKLQEAMQYLDPNSKEYKDSAKVLEELSNAYYEAAVEAEAFRKSQAGEKYKGNKSDFKGWVDYIKEEDETREKEKKAQQEQVKSTDLLTKKKEELASSLSKLESNYETLLDVVEDYNDNGKISIENYQKLLSLGDEWINMLSIQNGKLSVNADSFNNFADAAKKAAFLQDANKFVQDVVTMTDKDFQTMKDLNEIVALGGSTQDMMNKYAESEGLVVGSDKYNYVYEKLNVRAALLNAANQNENSKMANKIQEKQNDLLDKRNSLEEKRQSLIDAWEKEYAARLQHEIDLHQQQLNIFKNTIDSFNFAEQLMGDDETDLTIMQSKIQALSEYGSALVEEFNRVAAIVPKSADEAQIVSDTLEDLGSEIRQNALDIREAETSIDSFSAEKISKEIDKISESIKTQIDILDQLREMTTANNQSTYNAYLQRIAYSRMNYSLLMDNNERVAKRRKENSKLVKLDKKYQETIQKASEKTLDMVYDKESKERAKNRKSIQNDISKLERDIQEIETKLKKLHAEERERLKSQHNQIKDTIKITTDGLDATSQKLGLIANQVKQIGDNWTVGITPDDVSGSQDAFIYNYLTNAMGFTKEAALGVMGNLKAESNFNAGNLQNSYEKSLGMSDSEYVAAIKSGKYTREQFIYDQAGFGLAQWTSSGRKAALYDFIKNTPGGLNNIDSIKYQMDFLRQEMSNMKNLQDLMTSTKDIAAATKYIMKYYEGPKDQSTTAQDYRVGLAKDLLNLVSSYIGTGDGNGLGKSGAGYNKPTSIGTITSSYGNRKHPKTGKWKFHNGIDIGVPVGTPVYSIGDGYVSFVGNEGTEGFGKYIVIDHGNGLVSTYGHLSQQGLKANTKVKAGQQIGKSGNTGSSTGPHLHLRTELHGKAMNPYNYIPAYASGTKYSNAGLSTLAEQGAELIILPNGTAYLADKTMIANLPEGSQVIPSNITKDMVKNIVDLSKEDSGFASADSFINTNRGTDIWTEDGYVSVKGKKSYNNIGLYDMNFIDKKNGTDLITWTGDKQPIDLNQYKTGDIIEANGMKYYLVDDAAAFSKGINLDRSTVDASYVQAMQSSYGQKARSIMADATSGKITQAVANEKLAKIQKDMYDNLLPTLENLRNAAEQEYQQYIDSGEHNKETEDMLLENIEKWNTIIEDSANAAKQSEQQVFDDRMARRDAYISANDLFQTWSDRGETAFDAMQRAYEKYFDEYASNPALQEKMTQEYFSFLKDTWSQKIFEPIQKMGEKLKEEYGYQITRAGYLKGILEGYYDQVNKLKDTQHDINVELMTSKNSMQYLREETRKMIFNEQDYLDLTEKINENQEWLDDAYSKYTKKINALKDTELYKAEKLTLEYNQQVAAKERELDILRTSLDLVKKQNALNSALAERNVRVYSGGQWIQVANTNDVNKAMEDLAQTQYEIATKEREDQQQLNLDAKDMQVAIWTEAQSKIDALLKEAQDHWETLNSTLDLSNLTMETFEEACGDAMVSLTNLKKEMDRVAANSQSTAEGNGKNITISKNGNPMIAAGSTMVHRGISASSIISGRNRNAQYAAGTNNAPGGWSMVNERGMELLGTNFGQFIELSPHEKIFNNEQMNYLYDISSKSSQRMNSMANSLQDGNSFLNIDNLNIALDNVTNGASFIQELKSLNSYIRNTRTITGRR